MSINDMNYLRNQEQIIKIKASFNCRKILLTHPKNKICVTPMRQAVALPPHSASLGGT